MTSQHPSHADSAPSTKRAPPTGSPRLHVQRSQSKETITIHFSALGKEEEEEEEELFLTALSTTSNAQDDSSVATAVEASEEMFEEVAAAEATGTPDSSGLSPACGSRAKSPPTQTLSPPHVSERKGSSGSPTKSLSFPSSEKPFLNLVKSLSSDVESRDGAPFASLAPTIRHRKLMKNLVKVLTHNNTQSD